MAFYQSDTFTPDRSIGYLVRVINQAVQARSEASIAADGLTFIQWQVMASLYFSRSVTCASLARDLNHDKGAMTRLVDQLEERGFVERERDTGDRRVVNLTLTAAGRHAAERGRDHYVACWNTWLDGWDRLEIESLIDTLQRLRATIDTAAECAA